jgi:hypothetical protein
MQKEYAPPYCSVLAEEPALSRAELYKIQPKPYPVLTV